MSKESNLVKQFAYLRKLKAMSDARLRKHHTAVFKHSKYNTRIPKWVNRVVLERRLLYYFAGHNYHLNRASKEGREFLRQAKEVLSPEYYKEFDISIDSTESLKILSNFSEEKVAKMDIQEVDRCLSLLNMYIDGTETTRRKVLCEWYNSPAKDLIPHRNVKGQVVRPVRKGSANNKFYLRDLILEHPTLDFQEFRERFGVDMPTVTRDSFNNQRSILRKAGYQVPYLVSGVRNPAVKRGTLGNYTRARPLNRLTKDE